MTRFSPHREALILACAVWAIHVPVEMWIADRFLVSALVWAAHGLALMLGLGWTVERALRLRSSVARIATLILAPLAFATAQTGMDVITTYWIGHVALGELNIPPPATLFTGDERYLAALKQTFQVYLWPFGFYTVALILMDAIRRAFETRLAAQRAELDALRLQINPHFLFNALNSVTSLIVTKRHAEAEAMTLSLAHFYRNNLQSGHELAELDDEIDALESYVDLERIRLGDALSLVVDCPSPLLSTRIPSLLLQPLVENAIKHGGDSAAPIHLNVSAQGEHLHIVIDNLLAPRSRAVEGTGTGLSNVRQRLTAVYGDQARLTAGAEGDRWRVRLSTPLSAQAGNPRPSLDVHGSGSDTSGETP